MASAPGHLVLSLCTTVGSAQDARRLARLLVERRLAACVQIEPQLESHYRWEGSPMAEPEHRLTVKSRPECLPAIDAFMGAEHPYEMPQILWQLMSSSEAYARWVESEVTVPQA
jgi:periplasmic divalent cation tolerance protein